MMMMMNSYGRPRRRLLHLNIISHRLSGGMKRGRRTTTGGGCLFGAREGKNDGWIFRGALGFFSRELGAFQAPCPCVKKDAYSGTFSVFFSPLWQVWRGRETELSRFAIGSAIAIFQGEAAPQTPHRLLPPFRFLQILCLVFASTGDLWQYLGYVSVLVLKLWLCPFSRWEICSWDSANSITATEAKGKAMP